MLTTILILAAGMVQQNWYTFESEAKTFRVQLPARPSSTSSRTVTKATGRAQLTTAQLSTANATYTVQVTESAGKIDPQTLDDGIKQFAASKQATLGSVGTIAVDGNPGRQFELLDGQKRSKMRWVVSGNSLFVLSVAAKPGAGLPADADRFLGSLEIGAAKVAATDRRQRDGTAAAAPKPAPSDRAKPDEGEGTEIVFDSSDTAEDKSASASKSPPKATSRKPSGPVKLTISRIPKSAKPYPAENLEDLPRSFFGRDRDGFSDVGPEGAVLVGVRVSYIERFGGPKISSAQPIYRSGTKHYLGRVYGQILGPVTTAFAKPGYAVGGLITHTGLTVDGFRMVYMKVDGDRLDPSDSYNSPWLGDLQGGGPGEVNTKGGLIVGLQGRSGNEVNALGLTMLK